MRALAAAALALLALPAAAHAKGFPYGVAAGEVTSTSAILWTRASLPGAVTLEVSTDARFRGMPVATVRLSVSRAYDLTVQRRIAALRPGTRYRYRFRQRAVTSRVGSFRTAPPPALAETIRFAITGDADGALDPRTRRPAYNDFAVYARMAAERNHFNINLGDTIYSDSEIGGLPAALTVPQKWAKYRRNLAYPALVRLRAATGLYSHWDDHEFVNDFSVPEHGSRLYAAGAQAFRDYAPVRWSARDGLYRTIRWGRNLELFFLDERSFRSAKADDACSRDLAPTAPQPVRNAFAAIAPPLAQPVPQSCLEAIADPARTMLGARQYAAFTSVVAASTATWKVVVNEVPIHQLYALPYDRWEGYSAERRRLLEFLRANVRNVLFLTTDAHANWIGEVRLQTLEPGGPVGTGIWEVVTGPVATNTYSREIDQTLGSPGAGTTVEALFFKPAPPRGLGLVCSATDVYSYAQVQVTRRTLTVTPKDSSGRQVREKLGALCGPLVLRAD